LVPSADRTAGAAPRMLSVLIKTSMHKIVYCREHGARERGRRDECSFGAFFARRDDIGPVLNTCELRPPDIKVSQPQSSGDNPPLLKDRRQHEALENQSPVR